MYEILSFEELEEYDFTGSTLETWNRISTNPDELGNWRFVVGDVSWHVEVGMVLTHWGMLKYVPLQHGWFLHHHDRAEVSVLSQQPDDRFSGPFRSPKGGEVVWIRGDIQDPISVYKMFPAEAILPAWPLGDSDLRVIIDNVT